MMTLFLDYLSSSGVSGFMLSSLAQLLLKANSTSLSLSAKREPF